MTTEVTLLSRANTLRKEYHKQIYSKESYLECTSAFFAHKCLTVITLPANALKFVGGFGIASATALTLGVLKVGIFAITARYVKPEFPTFVLPGLVIGVEGLVNAVITGKELLYDAVQPLYQGYQLSRWIAGKLSLGRFLNPIFESIGNFFAAVANNISIGIKTAFQDEPHPLEEVPSPFGLNAYTHTFNINLDTRTFSSIAAHTLLTIPNSICNVTLIATGAVGTVGLGALMVIKIAVISFTPIKITFPTAAPLAYSLLDRASHAFVSDAATVVFDVFITTYKISEMLLINKALGKIGKILAFIPEALSI
ncbi:MAG: hypothetical protein WC222_09735 [Parachlamydiales bacterium]|jgi:hypothetical protein